MLLHGSDLPLQDLRWLRAGPLTVALDGVDLRYMSLGEVELVRRIYVAVRDRDWNTVPGVISGLKVAGHEDWFLISFDARHTSPDVDFSWRGTISGTSRGRISFEMQGQAERDSFHNRIGFCVLQPWRECAGRPFRAVTPSGPVAGSFPELVAPQRYEDGMYVPLVPSASALEVDLASGPTSIYEFAGDLFETEDQRNWSDASFKTYSTPMALGFPHELRQGASLAQVVTVSASASGPVPKRAVPTEVEVGDPTPSRVFDLGMSLTDASPSNAAANLLAALGPAHLRAEVRLDRPDWRQSLMRSLDDCSAIGAKLELALFLHPTAIRELRELGIALHGVQVARVLVAPIGASTATPLETTPADYVALARGHLALPDVPFAGGTDMYFCELNRTRPDVREMDGIFWSVNPQVHAVDDLSLTETPEAQGEQVRAAKAFAPGRQLYVGPVSLRRRFNVNATTAEEASARAAMDSADPRQASLLGAAWVTASAKHLSEQGARAVTYFDTVGPRGVIQGDATPPTAEFPTDAGAVFPLYHVLADVAALRGASVVKCLSTRPLELDALAVRHQRGLTVLAANLTPRRQSVSLVGVEAPARVRRLNKESVRWACRDPRKFRQSAEEIATAQRLELSPYETLRVDSQGATL